MISNFLRSRLKSDFLRVHQIELKMQNDELRRIQIKLEKSRDRYSHLWDFAPSAYFSVNETGIVTEANLTASAMLGHERAAVVGQRFTRFILPEDQDVWFLNRQRLLETGLWQTCQVRMANNNTGALYVNLDCSLIDGIDGISKQVRIAVPRA